MSAEGAKKIIAEVSGHDVDQLVRTASFTVEIEESVRGHIHQELTSWLFFRKLAADCSRSNISLHGFARVWERSAAECLADFKWLEKYLVSRGGRSKPTAIEATKFEWPDNPVEPVGPCKEALFVEKSLLEDLQRLCSLADKSGDIALRDAIQNRFMRKETRHVKDLADLLQQVVRVSKQPGLGLYLLDQELRHTDGIVPWDSVDEPSQQHAGTPEI
ncbi:hypothetical protein PENARI_c002G00457 [Penicillium arizonense]|uniref:Ferritin n=1 Tax=Penicillium arizonense TaxID=1835702 RepID=A0A1F5LUW8_PENAI|nr:hypothetical protein PENARI_c002G00457 [Penicillium arizonense]OGE56910.1 hypothetical protein PENARI_c002G00457 [Penicillium arizonense]